MRGGRPYAPVGLAEFTLLPGVAEAVERLRAASFFAIVVTNQPDVATGRQSQETVEEIHRLLRLQVPVDDIRSCYHVDADGCECRKPKPGMLMAAAQDHDIDLARSYMVGDRWRDIAAGVAAGCMTVFIDLGYDEARPDDPGAVVSDLTQAVNWILREKKE